MYYAARGRVSSTGACAAPTYTVCAYTSFSLRSCQAEDEFYLHCFDLAKFRNNTVRFFGFNLLYFWNKQRSLCFDLFKFFNKQSSLRFDLF